MPIMTREPQWYPKDYITAEQFDQWLQDIEQRGWRESVEHLLADMEARGQKRRSLEMLAFDESRADFHYLLPITPDAVVLDYGCGLGSIAFGLRQHCRHVVAMDQSLYRARLISFRAGVQGYSNMTAICGGNTRRLPFPDETFDVVVMNGVLEWMPRSQSGNPTEVQRRTLREVARVLKPRGAIYLAIENRYGYRYLLGRRDSHNAGRKLPFVTVLPRLLANAYTYAVSGVPYRTYLHSYWGLRGLLRSASFRQFDFYFPYPTYNNFKYIISFGDGEAEGLQHVLDHERLPRAERAVLAFLQRFGLAKYLAQDFAIVARK